MCFRGTKCRAIVVLVWLSLLLLVGCGAEDTPEPGLQRSPLATGEEGGGAPVLPTEVSPLPTPMASPSATPPATPTPPPPAAMAPLPLLVLHTNDNWGETEPCG